MFSNLKWLPSVSLPSVFGGTWCYLVFLVVEKMSLVRHFLRWSADCSVVMDVGKSLSIFFSWYHLYTVYRILSMQISAVVQFWSSGLCEMWWKRKWDGQGSNGFPPNRQWHCLTWCEEWSRFTIHWEPATTWWPMVCRWYTGEALQGTSKSSWFSETWSSLLFPG